MHFKGVEIYDYKSFFKSGKVELKNGINLIIGKNNSGKTSFLEVLTGEFKSKPHLNSEKKPRKESQIKQVTPAVSLSFFCPKKELIELSEDKGYQGKLHFYNPKFNNFDEPENRLLGWYKQKEDTFWAYEEEDKADFYLKVTHEELESFFKPIIDEGLTLNYSLPRCKIYIPKLQDEAIANSGNIPVVELKYGNNTELHVLDGRSISSDSEISNLIVKEFFEKGVFKFDVHRIVSSSSSVGGMNQLSGNADNLPTILDNLHSDRDQIDKYVQTVIEVFPEIKNITIGKRNGAEILIWMPQAISNRDDLAIPLSDCGTGIGQVMAMLHVVVNSPTGKVIIIDEPNSFLHPSASRKLIEIFRRYPHHQYIISTHSPEIISNSQSDNILLLKMNPKGQTEIQQIDKYSKDGMFEILSEVGVKLSDVYGYDQILWVEGETEQSCFPKIVEKLLRKSLTNSPILKVQDTGSFEKKHIRTTLYIYKKLIKGNYLLPTALGFIFDPEGRSTKDIEDLKRAGRIDGNDYIFFLQRRLYENYLLNPRAIFSILSNDVLDEACLKKISISNIESFLENNKTESKYWDSRTPTKEQIVNWKAQIHGAKLLEDTFRYFAKEFLPYRKTTHSVKLTEWIIENEPNELEELVQLLSRFY